MKKILFNIILFALIQSAFGQTATFYDFNTAGQLSTLFNGVGATGSVSQLTTGGIGNSGGINLPGGTNAIFSTKEGYSLGPAGSSDTFESFIKSEGPNGYSGVGFTASVPVNASSDGYYRPTDAIGISAHGGGFIFHNGVTNYSGNWNGTSLSSGITATKVSSVSDLLGTGSPSDWYKIIFKMTRATLSTFDLRVEIWTSDANGTMLDTTAAAIFEVNGVTNTALADAPILHSYFNFAGDRVRNFDNFAINLTGGGSVIQAGAPVVLTSSGSESNWTIVANGNVSSQNGGTVTERGFVYATTADPTIANNKVVSGLGLGTFSKSISGLSAGTTYYLRAYATNSTGTTSYGSDLSFTTASVVAVSVLNKYGAFTTDVLQAVNKNGAIGSKKGLGHFGGVIDAPLPDGSTPVRAGLSAVQIKTDYPSSTDGVYWIDVPGYGPKQTYCLMDNKYNGGGWMLALKATTGTTFNYDATYWTSANTLNQTDVTLTDSDSKYDVMNGFQAKDMMALWPDIVKSGAEESGSIDNLDRWSWLQNDFHSGNRITLISKFAGSQDTYYTATDGSMSFSGYNSNIFSSQPGYSFYGINYSGIISARVRWGFAWNNEMDQLTNDVSGGIGMSTNYGNYSAGDLYWLDSSSILGINRSARVEIYIR